MKWNLSALGVRRRRMNSGNGERQHGLVSLQGCSKLPLRRKKSSQSLNNSDNSERRSLLCKLVVDS